MKNNSAAKSHDCEAKKRRLVQLFCLHYASDTDLSFGGLSDKGKQIPNWVD